MQLGYLSFNEEMLMLHANSKFTCDAEIGGLGHWHVCGRKAVISRESRFVTLHFCTRHRKRAINPSTAGFIPKPDSHPHSLETA